MVVQGQRRVSARIQEKQEEKQRLVKRRVELLGGVVEGGAGNDKENNVHARKQRKNGVDSKKEDDCKKQDESRNGTEEEEQNDVVSVQTTSLPTQTVNELPNGSVVNLAEKSDTAKVKKTLRLFNKHYLHLVQVCFLITCLHVCVCMRI